MGWMFPWISKDVVYVGEYYEVEEKSEKVFIYLDPLTREPLATISAILKMLSMTLQIKASLKLQRKG